MVISCLKCLKLNTIHLKTVRTYFTVKRKAVTDENYVARQIYQRIRVKGPVTVADYMKEVLTNPMGGFYMHKDVFGETGDFITSPEITQMFGEMIAVWFLNEWQKLGSPKPFQIVELGPGRGTLSDDILKVFSHFKALEKASLKLVEISPHLSDIQAKKLCENEVVFSSNTSMYKQGLSPHGVTVEWYLDLKQVPKAFTLFIAHEFFDALPIHKFHKTYAGYREVLIDIEPSSDKDSENIQPKFRYVLAKNETPMSKILLKSDEVRDHIEISPDSLVIYQEIAERIKEYGGIALICDYGHYGDGTDSFRAFKKHKQVDPLIMPGTADLTADVDFKSIRDVIDKVGGIISLGPVTQRDFLLKTGLEYRLKTLLQNAKNNNSQAENLTQCFNTLVDKDKMGERFKFFALFPENIRKMLDKIPAVGFT